MKSFRFLLLFLFLSLTACSAPKNYIFIVDTSGSMIEKGLVDEVRRSIKKISKDYSSGDRFTLLTFDEKAQLQFEKIIQTDTELEEFFSVVDSIETKGQWTNLFLAIDISLQKVKKLLEKNENQKNVLILYTDGNHDPPPHLREKMKSRFDDFFSRYYQDYQKKKAWFIYYVVLDQPDQDFIQMLSDTKSGQLISRQMIGKEKNFLQILKTEKYKRIAFIVFLAIFSIILLLYFFGPWGKKGVLSSTKDEKDEINFQKHKMRLFFFHSLKLGSKGNVKIKDSKVEPRHAVVGVDMQGNYYIEPVSQNKVAIDGLIISKKHFLKPGEKVKLGEKEYVFNKNKNLRMKKF